MKWLAALFFLPGFALAGSWTCAEPRWIGDPYLKDGLFHAKVASLCTVPNGPPLEKLARVLRNEIENSGKYIVHQGPVSARQEEIPGWRYDLTDPVQDSDNHLRIRQKMFLGTDGSSRLLYETKSTKVEAEGNASYLRRVDFRTAVSRDEAGIFQLEFENSVEVERPWFAFGFLFLPIGRDVTKEKFVLARDKLLEYFAPRI